MDNNNIDYNYSGNNFDVYNPTETPKKNICGLLSFIFSLTALGLLLGRCCGVLLNFTIIGAIFGILLCLLGWLVFPLDIAALILGIVGVTRKDSPKEMATTGLIISIVVLFLDIVMVIISILMVIVINILGLIPYIISYITMLFGSSAIYY